MTSTQTAFLSMITWITAMINLNTNRNSDSSAFETRAIPCNILDLIQAILTALGTVKSIFLMKVHMFIPKSWIGQSIRSRIFQVKQSYLPIIRLFHPTTRFLEIKLNSAGTILKLTQHYASNSFKFFQR